MDKKYIRFGRIPPNGKSKAHRGDAIICEEQGVSVYDSIIANGVYFPILPNGANESGVSDYFMHLFCDKRVFLVSGDELPQRGSDGEPLLENVEIVKEITDDYKYLKDIAKKYIRSGQ